jgi:hypothetical protein
MRLMVFAAFLTVAGAAEVPIRTIVLYKNGVGYFERAGELKPGEAARLEFKAPEMNDVLKSLTIVDRSGEKITGIHYDSSEPLAQKLADFPFQLGQSASLAAFLDQMKGARMELKYGADTISGAIVSARVAPAEEKRAEREQLVVLLDSGELRTLDLSAATSIRLSDAKLQSQLRDYLLAVNQSRSRDKRSVYIDSSEAKERRIVASYMVPTPVWKSSYRLIFGEKAEPQLEGWAIIDNTSGEDWKNVLISVVSGRPVSFISRLYDAKFVQRQTVDLPEDRAAGPVLYEGGIANEVQVAAASPAPPPMPSGIAGGIAGAPRALRKSTIAGLRDAEDARKDMASNVWVNTEARDLGELFEYRFSTPITVKTGESAMLPFVQQTIAARKLLIYSESYGLHPMSAAELSNSTGKTLDGGPITVFDHNSYGGEALMETLKAGDKRLVSYAVDLGTRITTAFDSSKTFVRELHANRGVLTTRSAAEETKSYTIRNVDQTAKTLVIEHAQRPEYKVLNQKPVETTSNAWRFEVKVGANSTERFPVTEERVYDTTTAISSLTPDVIVTYVQNKALPEASRRQFQQVLDQKRQIATADAQIQRQQTEVDEVVRDQDRIRQNLNSLNRISGQQELVQKYANQLAAQESQLATMRDRLSDLRKQKTTLEAALNGMIEKLSF